MYVCEAFGEHVQRTRGLHNLHDCCFCFVKSQVGFNIEYLIFLLFKDNV